MSATVIRIKQYIDFKGISMRKFEESVGFSNGAFASQFKNGKAIGVDKVENILRIYPDINPVWLLTGKGSMLNNPTQATDHDHSTAENILREIIQEKDQRIEELSKKVGRLERELEERASGHFDGRDADTAACADAG